MNEAYRQTQWAKVLLSSLADAGVSEVIISPGSRSTPLVAAALQEDRLRCRSLIDERSAAFFALGQARITGRPSLLICTSGTAVANYFPAVVEAGVDHVPLLVLSADRPVELSQSGANQTIDQLKIFGDHARGFFDLGSTETTARSLRALRRRVAQAALRSIYPTPGAVHMNARLRKPLEPTQGGSEDELALAKRVRRLLAQPTLRTHRPRLWPDPQSVEALISDLRRFERGLIVCGPAPVTQRANASKLVKLARRLEYPILSETTSQLRFRRSKSEPSSDPGLFIDGFDAILRSARFRAAHPPEMILQIGRSPTSTAWEHYLEEYAGRFEHWVVGAHGWHDPQSTATQRVFTDLGPTLDALLPELEESRTHAAWRASWEVCEKEAWRGIEADLDVSQDGSLSEGSLTHLVLDTMPDSSLLAVGNSLPVRQVDLWARGRQIDIDVVSQRGASGIDGLLSGICGAACASQRPTLLLVGDISFLHDLSGLIAAREVKSPLVILVVNNSGGRIFEQLPLAQHPLAKDEGMDLWTTPHEASFEAAAKVHHLSFVQVDRRAELRTALREGLARNSVSVIEAVVPASGAVEENSRVRGAVREAIGELLAGA